MPMRDELTTVRVRLLLWFAAVLTASLVIFSGTVYLGAVAAEAAEIEPEAEKERELRQIRERLALSLLISTPVAVLVAAVGAHLLSRRALRAASGLRRFTADAAHELRTPLAILASDIEVCLRRPRDAAALRDTLETTLEGLGRLGSL